VTLRRSNSTVRVQPTSVSL